jgi:hypothetical protein
MREVKVLRLHLGDLRLELWLSVLLLLLLELLELLDIPTG